MSVRVIEAAKAAGESIWPEIDFDDIARGTVTERNETWSKRAGAWWCVATSTVSRHWSGTGPSWTTSKATTSLRTTGDRGDDFFASVGSRPEISIYWSHAQMQARQSDRMGRGAVVHEQPLDEHVDGCRVVRPRSRFLVSGSIRRRPEGADSAGLGTHIDTGNVGLVDDEGHQRAFRHVYDGSIEEYDPWDATFRTEGPQYPGTTMCSAFRTFQGWTALSDMDFDQGVLHAIPIPETMAYLLLRPMLDDTDDDDMCGVMVNKVFPINEKWHELPMQALSGIPSARAGDSVWWHCDLVHGVAPVFDQQGWGNVMYIGRPVVSTQP